MLAADVYRILELLKNRQPLDLEPVELQSMLDAGLLETVDPATYRQCRAGLEAIPKLEQEAEKLEAIIGKLSEKSEQVSNRIDSVMYRLRTPSQKKIEDKVHLTEMEGKLKALMDRRDATVSNIKKLKKADTVLDEFVECKGSYLRLRSTGDIVLARLDAAKARLGNADYDSFITECAELDGAIDRRFEKFREIYAVLIEDGFDPVPQVVQAALSMSLLEGDFNDIYERFIILNDNLYEAKWESYDRLPIVGSVIAQEGDTARLWHDLVNSYTVLVQDGFPQDYSTMSLASSMMRLKRNHPGNFHARFNRIRTELKQRDWTADTPVSCHIAAGLARVNGGEVHITENFRQLEKMLVAEGAKDCPYSGIASLTLLPAPGEHADKARKFGVVLGAMDRGGFGKNPANYGVAASVSLLPGTPEENVMHLSRICESLAQLVPVEDPKTLVNYASMILGNGFREYVERYSEQLEVRQTLAELEGYVSESAYGVPDYWDSLMIVDILDNGLIDFSFGCGMDLAYIAALSGCDPEAMAMGIALGSMNQAVDFLGYGTGGVDVGGNDLAGSTGGWNIAGIDIGDIGGGDFGGFDW
ncbi:hypothetical protein KY362_06615 [Candidatus Woesearchaeota archaeon]|nr:hypothetical protein [Candidatus Woesearchaeota archaeon]